MIHRVIPKSIQGCCCDNEGDMTVYLPEIDMELECYFIGDVDKIKALFPLHVETEALITFWYGKAEVTDKRVKALKPNVVGIYRGKSLDEDGEIEYEIESMITVKTNNELDDYKEPGPIGTWVECSGQFAIEEL